MKTLTELLTPREKEVLEFVAQGYDNGRIADMLIIEPKTVSRHINNIFSKLWQIRNLNGKHARVTLVLQYLKEK